MRAWARDNRKSFRQYGRCVYTACEHAHCANTITASVVRDVLRVCEREAVCSEIADILHMRWRCIGRSGISHVDVYSPT